MTKNTGPSSAAVRNRMLEIIRASGTGITAMKLMAALVKEEDVSLPLAVVQQHLKVLVNDGRIIVENPHHGGQVYKIHANFKPLEKCASPWHWSLRYLLNHVESDDGDDTGSESQEESEAVAG